jgi:hypothetical protein
MIAVAGNFQRSTNIVFSAHPCGVTWFVLVKCVAAAFSNYCAGVPVEVVGEEISDAFWLVHFLFFLFWFSSWGVVPFDVFNLSRFLILGNNYFHLFFMACGGAGIEPAPVGVRLRGASLGSSCRKK